MKGLLWWFKVIIYNRMRGCYGYDWYGKEFSKLRFVNQQNNVIHLQKKTPNKNRVFHRVLLGICSSILSVFTSNSKSNCIDTSVLKNSKNYSPRITICWFSLLLTLISVWYFTAGFDTFCKITLILSISKLAL